MATPVITGSGVWTYTMIGRQSGQVIMNVVHLRDTATGSIQDYLADAALLVTTQDGLGGFNQLFLAAHSDNYELEEIRVQPIYPQRMRAYVAVKNSLGAIVGGASPSANIACTLTKYAAGATRRDVGSMHLAGVPASAIGESILIAGHVAKVQAVADNLTDFWESGQFNYQFRPILWSRKDPTFKRDVILGTAHSEVRVVRRRTKGVGI